MRVVRGLEPSREALDEFLLALCFALLCFVLLGSARVLATVQQVADIALASSGPGGASGGSGTVLGAIACSCLRVVDGGLRRAGPCEIPASSPPQSSL